jgi:hypothetical protein
MKVVHCKKEHYDVYIGRPSKWGNPFTHIKDKKTKAEFVVSSREEAIQKYREWILTQTALLDDLHELQGKILGCWCKPQSCHGDVLIDLLKQNENNLHNRDKKIQKIPDERIG